MTTVIHSGHKSIKSSHLWDSLRAGETYPGGSSESDPFVLGQYRILECLGAGGMGKVFRAEHQLMGRQVVIKVMSPALLSDAESCARFRQEVRLVAKLSHPHIVLAHDADEEEGLHFFVMEYVKGADLDHIVAEFGPLPIPLASECIRQAALGLQHAHEHGLVHCDIKPSNLLLRGGVTAVYSFLGPQNAVNSSEKPLIKILDFGLARLAGKMPGLDGEAGCPEPGLCGTPDYMAPELGRDSTTVDIRCDLYSLGCTFSFLLTGQVPYPGGSWSEKLIRHHYDPAVPVCRIRPDVPEAIAAVVGRLMAKEPLDRFSTPGEVAAAIEAWQATEATSQRSATAGKVQSGGDRSVRQENPKTIYLPEHRFGSPTAHSSRADNETIVPRRTGIGIRWPIAACFAIALGLGSAYLATSPQVGKVIRTVEEWNKSASGQAGFRIGLDGATFSRLDQAVAAAGDADTIFVHGNGPFILQGIACRGKALTIKADAGFNPRFDLLPMEPDISWEPLFFANQSLTLEGIHLHFADEKSARHKPAIAHLIYVEDATLKLVDCKLTAAHAQALIVARRPQAIDIQNCSVTAKASALCIEIGENAFTKISMNQSRFEVSERGAAVVAFWGQSPRVGHCQLELDQNEFVGPRLFAWNGLDRAISVHAVKNRFHFKESLLSFVSKNPPASFSELLRWEGSNNQFGAGEIWVTHNSVNQPISNLGEWRKCWNCAENGSVEERNSALPASLDSSN